MNVHESERSSLLCEELRQDQSADQALQAVLVGLCGFNDQSDLIEIIDGHDAPEGIGGQLLQERFGQTVIIGEQLFEVRGAGKGPSIGQHARRVHGWILANSAANLLGVAPTANGVEILEGQTQRVDLRVAGNAVGCGGALGSQSIRVGYSMAALPIQWRMKGMWFG